MALHGGLSQTWVSIILSIFYVEVIIICICSVVQRAKSHYYTLSMDEMYWLVSDKNILFNWNHQENPTWRKTPENLPPKLLSPHMYHNRNTAISKTALQYRSQDDAAEAGKWSKPSKTSPVCSWEVKVHHKIQKQQIIL